jgi:2-iminobutanoate/2-iminopropanoate deaminase
MNDSSQGRALPPDSARDRGSAWPHPRPVVSKELGPPLGLYSHGMRVPAGELVVVAGQVGTDGAGQLVGPGDVGAQTRQAYENIREVLVAAGASMRDVVRFQTFLTEAADIDGFMAARREVFPGYYPDGAYPPNTLLVVSRLVQPELLVEIEAMAVRPVPPAAGPPLPAGRGRRRRASVGRTGTSATGKTRAGNTRARKGAPRRG